MSDFILNEKATDFLLYSYFGFDSSDIGSPDIIKKDSPIQMKCAHRAYLDLARTVKYKFSSSQLQKSKSNDELGKFKTARNDRIAYICKQLIKSIETCPNNGNAFDSWHNNECEKIKDAMNDFYDGVNKLLKEEFTYGQAQKWLNMTLKYLWLLDRLPTGLDEKWLHVPIDSFILEKLKKTGKFKEEGNEITSSGESYCYNDNAWSAIPDSTDYNRLQEEIRKIANDAKESPIEWESRAWMEIAKERSSK